MPFNLRLNVQNVFRRLGIQSGARLPQLNDNIQMTMVLTDLSRLIPAPIEPRGLAGANVNPGLGETAVCQLQALSPGGVFVEQLFMRMEVPAVTDNFQIEVSLQDLGLPAGNQINVGGTPIESAFTAGAVLVPTGGITIPSDTTRTMVNLRMDMFVPNQAFFSLRPWQGTRLDVAIIYRELPSVEEVG